MVFRESTLRRASKSNSLDEARDDILISSSPAKTEFTSLKAPTIIQDHQVNKNLNVQSVEIECTTKNFMK